MNPLIPEKVLREEILGISAVTFWSWRKNNKTPNCLQINRKRYYRQSDIEAWMDEMALKK